MRPLLLLSALPLLLAPFAGCALSHERGAGDASPPSVDGGGCGGGFFCWTSCDTGVSASCVAGAWVCPPGSSESPPSECCSPVAMPPRPGCRCDGFVWSCPPDVDAGPPASADAGFEWVSPPASFACGGDRCVYSVDYCYHSISDVSGVPDLYRCLSLPESCRRSASCETCFPGQPYCHDDGHGGVTLTSPGG